MTSATVGSALFWRNTKKPGVPHLAAWTPGSPEQVSSSVLPNKKAFHTPPRSVGYFQPKVIGTHSPDPPLDSSTVAELCGCIFLQ